MKKSRTIRFIIEKFQGKETIVDTLSDERLFTIKSICDIMNEMDEELHDAYASMTDDIEVMKKQIKKMEADNVNVPF